MSFAHSSFFFCKHSISVFNSARTSASASLSFFNSSLIFFSSIRQNLKSVLYDFKDSLIVLASIFIYICYFSAIGYFILEGTFQGYSDFDTYGDTFY